eukprot:SM000030S11405  [mRNA]  locus=s30:494751:498073:+ [translate_table: standard]
MSVSSYAPPPTAGGRAAGVDDNAAAGYGLRELSQMAGQEVGQGGIQTRLYKGRIARGPRMGTRVLMKVYPGRLRGGLLADSMAANELAAHSALQGAADDPSNIVVLLGGFQTQTTGEQWLVFRDNGTYSTADYAKRAAAAMDEGASVGEGEFWDRWDKARPVARRRVFVVKLLRGLMSGLAQLHALGRLHQSLGPASVVLNLLEERDVLFLQPRLRDLAFAVDVSDAAVFGGLNPSTSMSRPAEGSPADLADSLWRRAASAGAATALDRKAFGVADDIYAAGLLFAYCAFAPFCKTGSVDGPSLQRLFESTFRLDLRAAQEYCAADDRWIEAVKFLDLGGGAGWELLQAMLNPDYRQRPTAEAVLSHRFLTGSLL